MRFYVLFKVVQHLCTSQSVISNTATLRRISYCAFIILALLPATCIAHRQVVYTVPRYLIFMEHTCSSVCGQLTQFATTKFQQLV